MAGDGILQLGAVIDKTGVDEGLSGIGADVQAAVRSIAVSVEETTAKTRAAWNKLSEDVKVGAATMSHAQIEAAQASVRLAAAQADVRRAVLLTKDATIPAANSIAILAAAQTKMAETAASAHAKMAETAASAHAKMAETAASAARMEGPVTKSQFEAAQASVRLAAAQAEVRRAFLLTEDAAIPAAESISVLASAQAELAAASAAMAPQMADEFAGLKERIVLGAQGAKFQIRDLASSFSGMGETIAAVVAAGMVLHFANDVAKANVELSHLSVETGISIVNLAGLQQIVKETGIDWEAVSMGIVRMTKNLAASGDQFKEMKMALAGVGLSLEELQTLSPEQQLQKIAIAFANTADQGNVANAAIEIFGRGGKVLIPILKAQGAELDANMKKTGELTGYTNASAEAAERWTKDMADISMQLRSSWNASLGVVLDVLEGLNGAVAFTAALLESIIDGVGAAVTGLAQEFFYLGKTIYAALHFNVADLQADWQRVMHSGLGTVEAEIKHLGDVWNQVFSDFTGISMDAINGQVKSLGYLAPPIAPGLPAGYSDTGGGAGGKHGGARAAAMQGDTEQLNEMRLEAEEQGHWLSIQEEIYFWQRKLAAAKKGSEEYREIIAKLADLKERAGKGGASAGSALNPYANPEEEPPMEALAFNLQWAKRGPYTTALDSKEEVLFQDWIKRNKVPWQDVPTADYDMRGYWQALQQGRTKQKYNAWDQTMHFPDTWKTPYSGVFSKESMYALPNAPHWAGDKLVTSSDQLVADETPGNKSYPDAAKKADIGTKNPDTSSTDQQFIEGLQAQAKAVEQAAHEQLEIDRDSIQEKTKLAQEDYRNTVSDLHQELAEHRITKQQELALERDAANQEYQTELGLAREKEALDMGDRRAYARDLASESQLTRAHDRQMLEMMRQTANETAQLWQQVFKKISSDFNDAVAKWVITGKGFEQSMVTALRGITENFTKNVLQMTEQWLLGLLLQKNAMKDQVAADAKVAAANAYQAVVGVPVIGPVLAPAAAATAFAAVMAFESFDAGGVVGNRMGFAGMGAHIPILAEAGERMLTPAQNRNFESLVNQRSSSSSARLTQTNNFGGGVTKEMLDAHTNRTVQKMRSMLRPEAFA